MIHRLAALLHRCLHLSARGQPTLLTAPSDTRPVLSAVYSFDHLLESTCSVANLRASPRLLPAHAGFHLLSEVDLHSSMREAIHKNPQ